MRGKRMAEILAVRLRTSDLPSAALPASGSRGSSTTSQPFGSPALCFQNKTHAQQVNKCCAGYRLMPTFVSFVFFVVRKNDCRGRSARYIPQFLQSNLLDQTTAATIEQATW